MLIPPVAPARHSCRGILWLASAVACVAGTTPALSLSDLVSRSEVIASGVVTGSWTGWDSERLFIWTHTELRVENTWKGSAGKVITISEPGGSADGLDMQVPGSTPYSVGEYVNVYLYRTPLGYMRTVGYGQGKFGVSRDGRVRSFSPGHTGADGLSLAQLRTRVLQLLSKPAGAVAP